MFATKEKLINAIDRSQKFEVLEKIKEVMQKQDYFYYKYISNLNNVKSHIAISSEKTFEDAKFQKIIFIDYCDKHGFNAKICCSNTNVSMYFNDSMRDFFDFEDCKATLKKLEKRIVKLLSFNEKIKYMQGAIVNLDDYSFHNDLLQKFVPSYCSVLTKKLAGGFIEALHKFIYLNELPTSNIKEYYYAAVKLNYKEFEDSLFNLLIDM